MCSTAEKIMNNQEFKQQHMRQKIEIFVANYQSLQILFSPFPLVMFISFKFRNINFLQKRDMFPLLPARIAIIKHKDNVYMK